jgi:hypothetical protein
MSNARSNPRQRAPDRAAQSRPRRDSFDLIAGATFDELKRHADRKGVRRMKRSWRR